MRKSFQVNEDKDDPLLYPIVDDKDILWSTTVWEIIDLDEKINFPLLYPVTFDVVSDNRRPMLWWLRQEIEKGNLDVYDKGSFHGEFLRKEEKIDDIFKIKKPTDRGKNRIDDAKQELVESLKSEAKNDAMVYIQDTMEEAKLTAEQDAKKIIINTIQRIGTEEAVDNCKSLKI